MRYVYVGSKDLLTLAEVDAPRTEVVSGAAVREWFERWPAEPGPDDELVVTFVVTEDGKLWIGDRHSEHVACARGGAVLTAGELGFLVEGDVRLVEASNQSSGYCPEPTTWAVVASALDRAGIPHPGQFTRPIVFRRCPACTQRNIVKEAWFYCDACDAALPAEYNCQPA